MFRFSAKRSLIYAICLFLIYRIVYKVYFRHEIHAKRAIPLLSLQRVQRQITEANIILEPLQQSEEKHIAHGLPNEYDDKNESSKNLTLTTIISQRSDQLKLNRTVSLVNVTLSSVNITNNRTVQHLMLNVTR